MREKEKEKEKEKEDLALAQYMYIYIWSDTRRCKTECGRGTWKDGSGVRPGSCPMIPWSL